MNSGGSLRTPVFDKYKVHVRYAEELLEDLQQTTRSMRFVNNSTSNIKIKDRLGVHSILKATINVPTEGYVDVYVTWKMSEDAFAATYEDLLDRNRNPDSLSSAMINAFYERKHSRVNGGQMRTLEVHMEIHVNDIMAAGGSVYIEDLDITVCANPEKQRYVEHPFSRLERLKKGLAAEVPQLGPETFIMAIKAVDNGVLRNRHDRFMRVGDVIHHIPIERDLSMLDGIHVTSRRNAEEKNMTGEGRFIKIEHLSYEEADKKYNLFDSIEKARVGTSHLELQKEESLRRQAELKLEESERAREKSEFEHRQWREKAEFEAEHARVKDERQRRRADEDNIKENTRNLGDWIRMIGGIVSSVVALTATLAKLKPT